MFDEKVQQIFWARSTSNKRLFRNLVRKPNVVEEIIDQITSGKHAASAKVREMIVAITLGFTPNFSVNGHDCIDSKGKYWEIKTEQRTKKLSGVGVYHYSKSENLYKYQDQRILQSGFIEGKLVYIVSFPFKKTGLSKRLSGLRNKKASESMVSYCASSWQGIDDLKLHYLNQGYHSLENMTTTLFYTLEVLKNEL